MAYRITANVSWVLTSLLIAGGCFAEPDPVADPGGSTSTGSTSEVETPTTDESTSGASASGITVTPGGSGWSTGYDSSTGFFPTGASSAGGATTDDLNTGSSTGTSVDTDAVPEACERDQECGAGVCCDVDGLGCFGLCVPDCGNGNGNGCMNDDDACREDGLCYPPCNNLSCPDGLVCNPTEGFCEAEPGVADTGKVPDPTG